MADARSRMGDATPQLRNPYRLDDVRDFYSGGDTDRPSDVPDIRTTGGPRTRSRRSTVNGSRSGHLCLDQPLQLRRLGLLDSEPLNTSELLFPKLEAFVGCLDDDLPIVPKVHDFYSIRAHSVPPRRIAVGLKDGK